MAALAGLLPSLRSDRVISPPPSERLAYVAKEINLWRQAERTSSRGGSSSSAPTGLASGDADSKAGSVGYQAIYQVSLRRLLSSTAYVEASEAVTAALDAAKYDEAIELIWATGFLPLVHALIGERNSLPGYPLIGRIAEVLRALGPQWVADTLASFLLPANDSGMRRKRPTALPLIWAMLCKASYHKIAWEDVCYGVIAEGNNKSVPSTAPQSQVQRCKIFSPLGSSGRRQQRRLQLSWTQQQPPGPRRSKQTMPQPRRRRPKNSPPPRLGPRQA